LQGPENNEKALQLYANLLTENKAGKRIAKGKPEGRSDGRSQLEHIVRGIIEGETRSIISTMTMEELFSNRQAFRDNVIRHVQSELSHFGIKIYNANLKELQDIKGSEYFANLSRKAHEGTSYQAKVDVADARMKGDIGEAQRKGTTKQEIAQIDAATAVKETQRKAEKAKAELQLAQIEIEMAQTLTLSKIEAKRTAEERDNDFQKIVELKRAAMELERPRADKVTTARIERESGQEKADQEYYCETKCAEAMFLVKQNEARAHLEVSNRKTDATFYQASKDADHSYMVRKRVVSRSLKQQSSRQTRRRSPQMANTMPRKGGPKG
jgi:flotillin